MSTLTIQCVAVALILVLAIALDLGLSAKERTTMYRLRRTANWLTAGSAYVAIYMARYAIIVVNTAHVREALGVTPSAYGALLTCGFWAYALCTVLGGGVVDHVGGRNALMLGCTGCAAFLSAAGALFMVHPSFSVLLLLNMANLGCSTLGALSVTCWQCQTRNLAARRFHTKTVSQSYLSL